MFSKTTNSQNNTSAYCRFIVFVVVSDNKDNDTAASRKVD